MSPTTEKYNLLFIFTAVGLMQAPLTAGVRKAMLNIYRTLKKRGHRIQLLAPKGSICETADIPIIEIEGSFQDHLHQEGDLVFYPIYENSFLENALRYAKNREKEFDFIINFSNDWLPYYLTPFFETPLLHRMNLSNENAVVTRIIQKTAKAFPKRVGVLAMAQAEDVGIAADCFVVGQGLDLDKFPFYENSVQQKYLVFIARISPEKGLEDAAEIARRTGHQLKVFGHIQDAQYFEEIQKEFPETVIFKGHVPHAELVAGLSDCKALICSHKWVEAFAGVIIQAMACGLPVIAYERGGPKNVIEHGKTGFLVAPDNIEMAAEMVSQIGKIAPKDCRNFVENNYSLENLGNTYERWFEKVREFN